MFTRIFGKPKEQANALATLDKLNEVTFVNIIFT
jgi:predicted house-cleaning NTP pyrophosphatase (Maf/HAM1 superfamily)